MNNAFAIGTADIELMYIITIDAGAAIIAKNEPRKILRFEVERSDVLADLDLKENESTRSAASKRERTLISIKH